MATDLEREEVDLGKNDVLKLDLDGEGEEEPSTLHLIDKVLSNKHFNTFGLLEVMKRL